MAGAKVFAVHCHRRVETQLSGRGMRDHTVLTAMRTVPREAFVPPALHTGAYADSRWREMRA